MSATTGSSANSGFPGNAGYAGPAWFLTPGAGFNALDFLVRQIIAGKSHAMLGVVLAVQTHGDVAPAGTVAVQPLVNQVDGFGNQVPHGTIYNVPYFRLQSGANAIVLDPHVGDIGLVVVCDRDISNVKATNRVAGPGSFRQHDWADGCYIGGFLGTTTPTQFIEFKTDKIVISTPGTLEIDANALVFNVNGGSGTATINGNIATVGTLTNNSVNVGSTHVHSGVQSGSSDTGPPL